MHCSERNTISCARYFISRTREILSCGEQEPVTLDRKQGRARKPIFRMGFVVLVSYLSVRLVSVDGQGGLCEGDVCVRVFEPVLL